MSLHRISSLEQVTSLNRDTSTSSPELAKASFNPVGEDLLPPKNKENPVGAFEVSKVKRILQVSVAVLYCLFSAGVVFGFAAIKPILVQEGVYSHYCDDNADIEAVGKVGTCYGQEIRLNLMFTIAAVATNLCALPVGTLLDRYGPRISGLMGSFLIAVGALLLGFASRLPFDSYTAGYLFLALGGPFVFISSFQLSNTFPQHSGLILALLTGAFDSSSAVFLMYRLIYSASSGAFKPEQFFLAYLIVPIFIAVVQLTIMPAYSYKTAGEMINHAKSVETDEGLQNDAPASIRTEVERYEYRESVVTETTALLGENGDQQQQEEERKQRLSGVWGALHGLPASRQIKTPWFILIAAFSAVQMTRVNYFVATVRTQYDYILDPRTSETINDFFDIALPIGGVLSIPFIGLILDNTSTVVCLTVLVSVATAIGVLGVLPFVWAAYGNIALFVLYRPLYYTAVSDYSAKVFGFHTFGKVYGLVICLAGLINFSQSGLDALTHKAFNSDPIPINVALILVALAIGVPLIAYVWYKSQSSRKTEPNPSTT